MRRPTDVAKLCCGISAVVVVVVVVSVAALAVGGRNKRLVAVDRAWENSCLLLSVQWLLETETQGFWSMEKGFDKEGAGSNEMEGRKRVTRPNKGKARRESIMVGRWI